MTVVTLALALAAAPAYDLRASVTDAAAPVPGLLEIVALPSSRSGVGPAAEPPQMPGWPRTTGRAVNFVPARGMVFADLDNDGVQEILAPSTQGQVFAWRVDGSLVPGFPVTTVGFPQYPPVVGDMDGDGQVEIVQTTRGFTSGGRLYAFNAQGQALPGFPKNVNNNNMEYCATLGNMDADPDLEIVVGERAGSIGRLHVFNKDGSSLGGNWPVTLDHVPTMTAAVGDVDNDGQNEVFYPSYNSMYLLRRDGTSMPGWPQQIPSGAKFSYQSAALVDLDGDNDLEIIVGAHQTGGGFYAFHHTGAGVAGWPKFTSTWTYCPPTVTDLENDGQLEVIGGQAGGVAGPSNAFWVWNAAGQVRSGFPYVVNSGGSEGPLTVADIDGDGVQEIFADSNAAAGGQGFLYGVRANGQPLPDFPLRTAGFTYLNSATIGDVDGDGDYELGVIAAGDTTVTLYLYTLGTQYRRSGLEWGGYHARNRRGGLFVRPLRLAPDTATVRLGRLDAGNVASLAADDADVFRVCRFIVPNTVVPPINVEFEATVPSTYPAGSIEFTCLARGTSINLAQRHSVWAWTTSAWADGPESPLGLTESERYRAGSVPIHVQAGTGRVRARTQIRAVGPVTTGAWCAEIDRAGWIVGP